ncbi:hypothetical protein QM012_007931 [Aureobasidium pullulans]|uniref:Uncharacterized protein n=1 Tax=Aureobasidium pullulans TaxID=5580 RepID=A0ABR0TLX0_AURPU
MSSSIPINEIMENLTKIPMSQERFDGLKAKILQQSSKSLSPQPDEQVQALQNMTMKCVQDIKERLAYITEKRKQKTTEENQKNLDFAAGLAERNAIKESEKMTKKGQKAHRTRIEVWRDEVRQHCLGDKKKTTSGIMPQQEKLPCQSTAKRPFDSIGSSVEQVSGTATPTNKRIKTATQNDSSSAVGPPTSSKKSIPWLSTRASMAEENIFANDCRHAAAQEIRFYDKNTYADHEDNDDHDHDDADEEFDKDEDEDSDGSYASCLTELEQMLTKEMAMVTVMALMLPAMMQKSQGVRQGFEEGELL